MALAVFDMGQQEGDNYFLQVSACMGRGGEGGG